MWRILRIRRILRILVNALSLGFFAHGFHERWDIFPILLWVPDPRLQLGLDLHEPSTCPKLFVCIFSFSLGKDRWIEGERHGASIRLTKTCGDHAFS